MRHKKDILRGVMFCRQKMSCEGNKKTESLFSLKQCVVILYSFVHFAEDPLPARKDNCTYLPYQLTTPAVFLKNLCIIVNRYPEHIFQLGWHTNYTPPGYQLIRLQFHDYSWKTVAYTRSMIFLKIRFPSSFSED